MPTNLAPFCFRDAMVVFCLLLTAFLPKTSIAQNGEDKLGGASAPRPYTDREPPLEGQYKRIHQYAMKRMVTGDNATALEFLERFREKNPDDAETHFMLAVVRARMGDLPQAETLLARALSLGTPPGRLLAGPREILQPLRETSVWQQVARDLRSEPIHGPMLGSVTDRSARIWVRTSDQAEVRVHLRRKGTAEALKVLGPWATKAETDWTTVMELDGLQPATEYEYQISLNGGERLGPFQLETFPAEGEPLAFRLAFGGGAGWVPPHERMWDTIASFDPQALLLLGDNIYSDDPETPEIQKYSYYRRQSRPEWRRVVSRTPVFTIWDDHDFGTDDSWGGPLVDVPAWKRPVWEVFRQNWNNPAYGGGADQPGCWYDFTVGDIHFIMLDGRYYRTDAGRFGGPGTERPSMLGPVQMAWLRERLVESTGTFKVLVSPVPWDFRAKAGQAGLDTWRGYAEEREELFSWIDQHQIEGVVLMSADRHRSDAWRIDRPGSYDLFEFNSSRLTNEHLHETMNEALFSYNAKQSFGLVSFNTMEEDPTVTYDVISIDGEKVHSLTVRRSQLSTPEFFGESKEGRSENTGGGSGRLTLDSLFEAKEFDAESIPPWVWSKQGPTYYSLQPAESDEDQDGESQKDEGRDGKGRDVVSHNLMTGERSVVVAAEQLVPEGEKKPLVVKAFEFSPDETKLLIYTNSQRVWRYETRGDYWLLDLESGSLRQLGGDAEPSTLMFAKFSPDGRRVAYVRDHNLYVQDVNTLEIQPITTDGSETRINGTSDWVNEEELGLRDCFRWSPDGRRLLFWQFDTSGVGRFHLINNTDGLYPEIISFPYPKVGEMNSSTRLGVASATGGDIQWLSLPGDPREHYLPHAEWTPDGDHLLVQQFNRLQNENRLMRVELDSGAIQPVMTETDEAWLDNDNPVRWLEEGKSLLWLSERSGWRQAYRVSLDGGEPELLTQAEMDVISIAAVDQEDGWLYFMASPDNATQQYLYRCRLTGGIPQRVSPQDQPGWHGYNVSPDGKSALQTHSRFALPPRVSWVSLPDHEVIQSVTDNPKLRERLAAVDQPEVEFFQVDIGEGLSLDGWCLKPPEFDANQKYPLLIYVYGEPYGQTVRDMWMGPRGLWHWMMAQKGCVVVSIDNRGTNVPRGRAWRKSVHRRIGIVAPREQAAALQDLLKNRPYIDSERVAIWGWSGGGSMSLNAIFRYPELYHTAMAVAPVPDQLLYDTIYQERYMGLPADNEEGYREGSPLTHAHQLRGNLLLIHGTGDDNCHYQGTERLIDRLVAHGKHFTVLPYPNRSHSVNERENTVRHFWGYLTRYLEDNLLAE
jgi:dipeptidyl-peptidase 4